MNEPTQTPIEAARKLVADCVRATEAARINCDLAQERLDKTLDALRSANDALEQVVLSQLIPN